MLYLPSSFSHSHHTIHTHEFCMTDSLINTKLGQQYSVQETIESNVSRLSNESYKHNCFDILALENVIFPFNMDRGSNVYPNTSIQAALCKLKLSPLFCFSSLCELKLKFFAEIFVNGVDFIITLLYTSEQVVFLLYFLKNIIL